MTPAVMRAAREAGRDSAACGAYSAAAAGDGLARRVAAEAVVVARALVAVVAVVDPELIVLGPS